SGDETGACAFATTFLYDSVTGVLTVIGTASVSDYQSCLRSVKYENTSQNPNTSSRTIDVQVFDSAGAVNDPVPYVDLTVFAVNDAPVVSALAGPASVNESDSADRTYTFTVDDPDSTSFDFVAGYPDCGSGAVHGSPSITG